MVIDKFYLLFLFWSFGFIFLWNIPLLVRKKSLPHPIPKLSILIPARNEAKRLGVLLPSLRRQGIKPHEIIVIDDQSNDETAEVARREGCLVISITDLPEGWTGKNWACWQGTQKATGELFLFLDADTVMEPDGLEKIVSAYLELRGLVTLQPYHRMEKAYERLSAFFNLLTVAGVNAFTLLGSKVRPSGAFGPCMICARDDYWNVGGHARVKGEVLESLSLGKAFLAAGLPVHGFGGKGTIAFRMYPEGLPSLVEGFSKGFGTGAKATSRPTLLMIIAWIFGAVGSARELIQSMLLGPLADVWGWGFLYGLYVFQLHGRLRQIGNFGFPTALLYPIPLFFFIAIFITSLLRILLLRKVRWKGREVRTGVRKA
ncbi:MAG: glycosyltransferase family 2 protein [Desulfobacterota bacterium]|nr:glycosyltransferase family 2 protein [Thermodesulfobacteriota bacterium]